MTRGFDIRSFSGVVARAIFDGVTTVTTTSFPTPCQRPWPTAGRTCAKALERQFAPSTQRPSHHETCHTTSGRCEPAFAYLEATSLPAG